MFEAFANDLHDTAGIARRPPRAFRLLQRDQGRGARAEIAIMRCAMMP